MGGEDCAVAWQRESDGLVEAVHRVGCKHAGARSACGTSELLKVGDSRVVDRGVGGVDHHVNQVERTVAEVACLHRTSRHEYRRDVQPHGCHEHSRSYLVAVADTHHRVGLVGIDHIFNAVGYQVARRQGVEHAVVPHGDAVVDGYRVELGCETSKFLNLLFYKLSDFVQVRVPGHKLGERVDNGNHGLAYLLLLHSVGSPQSPCSRHAASLCALRTSQWFAHNLIYKKIDLSSC